MTQTLKEKSSQSPPASTASLKDIELFAKPQALRLWDVFFFGPFLITAGMLNKNKFIKTGLVAGGLMTMVYNGRNYLLNKKREMEIKNGK